MKIKTFEQTLSGNKSRELELKTFEPPKPRPRNSGIVYNAKNRDVYVVRLGELLFENELRQKKLTSNQIREQLIGEHKHIPALKRRLMSAKYTIGQFRNKYNQGKLYSSQPPVHLLSFAYEESGYIVVSGRRANTFAMFEDCYHHCVRMKVADPRFVPHELIVEIRNRQNDQDYEWLEWVVPTDDEIKKLQTKLRVKEIYNSVKFYPGFTREDTPKDFEPTILGV